MKRINFLYYFGKRFLRPAKLLAFFLEYDDIFTTNYDTNIEQFTGKEVKHLHGQFDILEPVYDINSYRNQISDKPAERFTISSNYKHVYCNALMDYSKEDEFKKYTKANNLISKLALAVKEDPEAKRDIDSWKNHSNNVVRNAYEGINIKINNPSMMYREYPLNDLESLSGKLTILGLSPNNDTHLLQIIKENSSIETIQYYFFDKTEGKSVKLFFDNKEVICFDVRKLWESFNS